MHGICVTFAVHRPKVIAVGAHRKHEGKTAEEDEQRAGCAPGPGCRAGSAASGGVGAEQGEQTSGSSCQQAMVEVVSQVLGGFTEDRGREYVASEVDADIHKEEGDQSGAARDDHEPPPDSRGACGVQAPVGQSARVWCRLHPYPPGEPNIDPTALAYDVADHRG
jgi:hypothetical protein